MVRLFRPLRAFEMWRKPVIPVNEGPASMSLKKQLKLKELTPPPGVPTKIKLLLIAGGTVCMGCGMYASHTFASKKYQGFIEEVNSKGDPVYVSRKLRDLKDRVAVDLNYPSDFKVRLFCSSSGIVEPIGCATSQWGARLGLPVFLNYECEGDVPLDVFLDVELDLPEDKRIKFFKEFKTSSLFSESEKQYAIAEGLLRVKDNQHFMHAVAGSPVAFLLSCIQAELVAKFTALGRHYVFQGISYLFGFLMWLCAFAAFDLRAQSFNFKNAVACLNEEYVDGGIGYYEKLLARHKVLREAHPGLVYISSTIDMNYVNGIYLDRLAILKEMRENRK